MVPFTAPVKAGIALASAGFSATASVASGLQNKKIADRNALILGMNAKREQEIALRAADDFAREEQRRRASGRAKGKGRTDEGSGLLVQVDQAGEAARARFRDYPGELEFLSLGGDRVVLGQFLKRVKLPDGLGDRVLPNRVAVDQPGRSALDHAVREAWSYRSLEFTD